jgi:hypothetical protein
LSLSQKTLLLAKHIITFFNNLRKIHNFTFKEYEKINNWSNAVWTEEYKTTELKQYCANCQTAVSYMGRYPKCICSACASKDKFDNDGNLLDFYNVGFSGGFKIVRKDRAENVLNEDDTQQSCDCFIDNKLFFAREARFGGIVIQLKES